MISMDNGGNDNEDGGGGLGTIRLARTDAIRLMHR